MDASLVTRILREITPKLSFCRILFEQTQNFSFDVCNVLGGKETLKLLQGFQNTPHLPLFLVTIKKKKKHRQASTLNQ